MPYRSREKEGREKVVPAGDRRMHHEGNRDEKNMGCILWRYVRQLKELHKNTSQASSRIQAMMSSLSVFLFLF